MHAETLVTFGCPSSSIGSNWTFLLQSNLFPASGTWQQHIVAVKILTGVTDKQQVIRVAAISMAIQHPALVRANISVHVSQKVCSERVQAMEVI